MHTMGCGCRLVSWLTKELVEHSCTPLTALRDKWEAEMGRAFNDREWVKALAYHTKVSRNAR